MPGRTRRRTPASVMAWAARTSRWAVSVEFDELDRRAEERRGSPRFCDALLRLAVRRRFAARAHDEMRRPPGKRLLRDHPAATELDVVRMCAEGQHRQGVRWELGVGFIGVVRSRPGGQK